MPRLIGDGDTVYACPSCDKAGDVYQRTHRDRDYDHECKCHKCGHEFDDPVERAPKARPANLGGDPTPRDDDGLPNQLADGMKERIRELRDGGIA